MAFIVEAWVWAVVYYKCLRVVLCGGAHEPLAPRPCMAQFGPDVERCFVAGWVLMLVFQMYVVRTLARCESHVYADLYAVVQDPYITHIVQYGRESNLNFYFQQLLEQTPAEMFMTRPMLCEVWQALFGAGGAPTYRALWERLLAMAQQALDYSTFLTQLPQLTPQSPVAGFGVAHAGGKEPPYCGVDAAERQE